MRLHIAVFVVLCASLGMVTIAAPTHQAVARDVSKSMSFVASWDLFRPVRC